MCAANCVDCLFPRKSRTANILQLRTTHSTFTFLAVTRSHWEITLHAELMISKAVFFNALDKGQFYRLDDTLAFNLASYSKGK